MPGSAAFIEAINARVATDMAYGVATLTRKGKTVAETKCSMFPVTWFGALQEHARVGDLVEVRLGRPLNRTERFYMAATNHNGLVTHYCTEAQWNWKPPTKRRGRR